MTLRLTELDIAFSQRLEPIRQMLIDSGIIIATLPKEVGETTQDDIGALNLRIPSVTSIPEDEVVLFGYQNVVVNFSIGIHLSKRFRENEKEVDVLEWIVDRIVYLLLGYSPLGFQTVKAVRFERYELFRPEHKMWLAELQFSYTHTVKGYVTGNTEPPVPEAIQSIELFGGKKLDFSDTLLIEKIK